MDQKAYSRFVKSYWMQNKLDNYASWSKPFFTMMNYLTQLLQSLEIDGDSVLEWSLNVFPNSLKVYPNIMSVQAASTSLFAFLNDFSQWADEGFIPVILPQEIVSDREFFLFVLSLLDPCIIAFTVNGRRPIAGTISYQALRGPLSKVLFVTTSNSCSFCPYY